MLMPLLCEEKNKKETVAQPWYPALPVTSCIVDCVEPGSLFVNFIELIMNLIICSLLWQPLCLFVLFAALFFLFAVSWLEGLMCTVDRGQNIPLRSSPRTHTLNFLGFCGIYFCNVDQQPWHEPLLILHQAIYLDSSWLIWCKYGKDEILTLWTHTFIWIIFNTHSQEQAFLICCGPQGSWQPQSSIVGHGFKPLLFPELMFPLLEMKDFVFSPMNEYLVRKKKCI